MATAIHTLTIRPCRQCLLSEHPSWPAHNHRNRLTSDSRSVPAPKEHVSLQLESTADLIELSNS